MPLFDREAAERLAARDIGKHFLDARSRWENELRKRGWNPRRLPRTFTQRERDLLAAILFRRMLETAKTSFHETSGDRTVEAGTVGNRVVDRMRNLSSRVADGVVADTVDKLRKGRTLDPNTRRDAFDGAFSRKRAEGIAITTTTAARSTGQLATALTLLDEESVTYEWVTADDGRVCPVCGPLHGMGEDVWRAKFPNGPPAHPRCLLPNTDVLASGIIAGMRAWYDGPAIRITMAKGGTLAVTGNHNLLTPQGLVPAHALQNGDYLISGDLFQRVAAANPYDDNRPSRIQDVVTALAKSGGMTASSVPATAEHLHGDGRHCDGNINVVWSDRFLWGCGEAALIQPAGQKPFVCGLSAEQFQTLGNLDAMFGGLALATHGGMCSVDQAAAFLRRRFSHADAHRFRSVPGSEASSGHPVADSLAGYADAFRHFLDGFPTLVATDQISNIERFTFTGHVYDLQTVTGLYVAGGVVSGNCRCDLKARFKTKRRGR